MMSESKTYTGSGAGFHIHNMKVMHSYILPDECTVFQCELFPIKFKMAYEKLLHLKNHLDEMVKVKEIIICSDSQAPLKALVAFCTSSILFKEWKKLLKNGLGLNWVH